MNYDRPGPTISAPDSGNQFQRAEGACAAVSVFIIWFVICLDSCYGNHCSNHCTGHDPTEKSFNDRFGILIIVGQTSTKVHLRRAASLLTVPSQWIYHSSAYPCPRFTKIYFSLPLQCLRIRALTMRPWLQLLSVWRASRVPVNHRLLYLGHSKSSCVMPCYLSSNNHFFSNPDSSLSPPPFLSSPHSLNLSSPIFHFLSCPYAWLGIFIQDAWARKRNVIA